jgi:hypothetical protein
MLRADIQGNRIEVLAAQRRTCIATSAQYLIANNSVVKSATLRCLDEWRPAAIHLQAARGV